MSSMEKSISVKELAPGMYVVRYGQGTFADPFVHVERRLMSRAEIRDALPPGIGRVVVDTDKGHPLSDSEQGLEENDSVGLEEEFPVAEKLYSEAVSYARVFMEDVRRGKPLDYRESLPLVDHFIASVFRNESAAASISRLRKFDEYTFTHCTNVSILAVILGKNLGLQQNKLELLGVAGLFHDVGKARIPEQILNKPGKLTEREFNIMKTHPLEGYKVLQGGQGIHSEVLKGVVEHHERFDGRGYPMNVSGENLGSFSRILAVVDVYDALTSKRVYKPSIAPSKALAMLYTGRGDKFDPAYVESFIKCMGIYPVGSFVRLTGGEYGVVCDVNAEQPLKPKVKIVFDAKMRAHPPRMVDLSLAEPGREPDLEIADCINPADYKIDVSRLFF